MKKNGLSGERMKSLATKHARPAMAIKLTHNP